jgi:hypothetical protein
MPIEQFPSTVVVVRRPHAGSGNGMRRARLATRPGVEAAAQSSVTDSALS